MFLKLRILAVKKGKSFFRRRGCDRLMLEKLHVSCMNTKGFIKGYGKEEKIVLLKIFENISICPVLGKCEPRKLPTLPKNSVINLVVEYRTLKLEGLSSLIVPPVW